MSITSRLIDYWQSIKRELDIEYKWTASLSLLEWNPSAKLLDCGCSDGEFTVKIAETVGTKEVCGIDIAEENCSLARAKGIKFYQADLNNKLPFDDESFDVIFANQVIEHLYNTDLFLKETRRILKNSGYVILTTPNLASFHNILFLLLGRQPIDATVSDKVFVGVHNTATKGLKPSSHLRLFTIKALTGLLAYHGFKVEKVIMSGFLPFSNPLARFLRFIDKTHAANITLKARKKIRA